MPVRYVRWLTAMVQGDWGFSFASRIDVDKLILQRLPTTLFVIGSAQILALLIALPVGVFAATRPYSIFDQIASTFAFIGFSLPTFFTGLLFILVFSIYLDWLPFVYRADLERHRLALVLGALPAGDHADHRARPRARRVDDALRALRRARRDPPRLRHDGARQGARRARRHHQARACATR